MLEALAFLFSQGRCFAMAAKYHIGKCHGNLKDWEKYDSPIHLHFRVEQKRDEIFVFFSNQIKQPMRLMQRR